MVTLQHDRAFLFSESLMPLRKGLADGQCVAFVGAGLSTESGAPNWKDLVRGTVRYAEDGKLLNKTRIDALKRELEGAFTETHVLQLARKYLGRAFEDYVQKRLGDDLKDPSPTHDVLVRMRLRAIITTNLDCLLETAYEKAYGKRPPVFTWRQAKDALDADREHRFYIWKIHGCIRQPASWILTHSEYRKVIEDAFFMNVLRGQFFLKTILFLGYGLEGDTDIGDLLNSLPRSQKAATEFHYHLLHKDEAREAKRLIEARSRIRIIPYDNHADIPSILSEFQTNDGSPSSWRRGPEPAIIQGLDNIMQPLGWTVTKRLNTDCGVVYLCEMADGKNRRHTMAIAELNGAESKTITRAYYATEQYSRDETILLAPSAPAHCAPKHPLRKQMVCLEDLRQQAAGTMSYAQRLASSTPEVRGQVIDETYVQPQFVVAAGFPLLPTETLDDYVLRWLRQQVSRELWVLGDFGTGKTWFAHHVGKHIASQITTGAPLPTPVVIALREYASIGDDREAFVRMLKKRGLDLANGETTLDWLLREGRLLLILDGADEAFDSLWRLKALSGECSVIITCRTHYFPTVEKYTAALDLKADAASVVEIRGLDDKGVINAIKARQPKRGTAISRSLARCPDLYDLAHRPLFLDMLVEQFNGKPRQFTPTIAQVYDSYILKAIERRCKKGPDGAILARTLEQALRLLAHKGQKAKPRQLRFNLSELLDAAIAVVPRKRASQERQAIASSLHGDTVLVRNPEDSRFEFGHLSLQEYLAAKHLSTLATPGKRDIEGHVADEDWQEVCYFYASVSQDARSLAKACLKKARRSPQCLFLAARCLEAARQLGVPEARQVADALVMLFGGRETKAYKFLEDIYRAIGNLGPAAKLALRVNFANGSPVIRRRCALTWFESFGHDAFDELLPWLEKGSLRPLNVENRHVRWHIAEVLAEVAARGDLPRLEPFTSDSDLLVRGNILWTFARFRRRTPQGIAPLSPGIIEELRRIVKSPGNIHPRAHGALLLGRCIKTLGWEPAQCEDIGKMLCALLDIPSEWRGYVARAIDEMDWTDGVPALCKYLAESGDDEIWLRYAVDAVERMAKEQHVPAIYRAAEAMKGTRHVFLHTRLKALAGLTATPEER